MTRRRWRALAVVMLACAVVLATIRDGLWLGAVLVAAVALINTTD